MASKHLRFNHAELPANVVALVRPKLPELIDRITSQIQLQVNAYAGPRTGRRRQLIEQAVSKAVYNFVDVVDGRPGNGQLVDELFRRMGRSEAIQGKDLNSMRAAYTIATRDAWELIHQFALSRGLSATVLGSFGDALFAYMDYLIDQVSVGYQAGLGTVDRDTQRARKHLLSSLLAGSDHDDLRSLAASAVWPLPERLVICAVVVDDETPIPEGILFEDKVLTRVQRPISLLLCDAEQFADIQHEIRDVFGPANLAISWPVPHDEVPDAERWTRRALELARVGVLDVGNTIWCEEHLTTLWLYAEPRLSRRTSHGLLEPLRLESPHYRQVLSETLLAWLETNASAPALAERFGVHPQTIRYRLKRLEAMFGEHLNDTDDRLAMILTLRSSLPLRKAGQPRGDIDFQPLHARHHDAAAL